MTVGNAEQIVSTTLVKDSVPFLFRSAGGGIEIADREYLEVVGGTLCWNQKISNALYCLTDTVLPTFQSTFSAAGLTVTKYDAHTFGIQGIATSNVNHLIQLGVSIPIGHYYMMLSSSSSISELSYSKGIYFSRDASSRADGGIYQSTSSTGGIGLYVRTDFDFSTEVIITPQVFDLTAMFGIHADSIITLLQSLPNNDARKQWFRNIFPKAFYEQNFGGLISVNTSAFEVVGFNLFDATTGEAQLVGGVEYQITGTYTSLAYEDINGNAETITPDSNGIFIPTLNGTLTVTGGNSTDTCVHFVWDEERNDEYEQYIKRTYALDSSIILRGMANLDGDDKLYYSGDLMLHDGTVIRNYGEVDLGTLTWGYTTLDGHGYFYANPTNLHLASSTTSKANIICSGYDTITWANVYSGIQGICVMASAGVQILRIFDSTYMDDETYPTAAEKAAALTTALDGVYLVYELATPTSETASETFPYPFVVNNWGTEQFIVAEQNGVSMPVGHNSWYNIDLKAKLEAAPESPSADGDYIMRQTAGHNAYVLLTIPIDEIPAPPATDGTYTLQVTVADGVATYSWA